MSTNHRKNPNWHTLRKVIAADEEFGNTVPIVNALFEVGIDTPEKLKCANRIQLNDLPDLRPGQRNRVFMAARRLAHTQQTEEK